MSENIYADLRLAIEDVFLPYLRQVLAQNPVAQHATIQAQFAEHMAFLTDFCLSGYPGPGGLTVEFIKGLHRAMFPPGYRQEIVTRDGHKVWMVPGEFGYIEDIESAPQKRTVGYQQISIAIENLVSNVSRELLGANSAKEKNLAILRFHGDFLRCRPFLDGNGRIACILIEMLASREALSPYYLHSIKHDVTAEVMAHRHYLARRIVKMIQKVAPQNVVVLGKAYFANESVLNPAYYTTSKFMAENICVDPTDIVLDMGTGSGIQAIEAACVARRVVAVDINPDAVFCARENVKCNGLSERVEVVESDLFGSLPMHPRFNVILFTPPYFDGEIKERIDNALNDPGKILARRFFLEARNRLYPGGYVQMLYTSVAQPERVLAIAEELGWRYRLIAEKKSTFETYFIYKLTLC